METRMIYKKMSLFALLHTLILSNVNFLPFRLDVVVELLTNQIMDLIYASFKLPSFLMFA